MKQKSQELQEDSIQLSTNHRSPNPLSHGGGSHTVVCDPRPIQCASMLYRKNRCVRFVMILNF